MGSVGDPLGEWAGMPEGSRNPRTGENPHLWLGVHEDSIEIDHQDIADGQDGGGASWSAAAASDVSAGEGPGFRCVPSSWMRATSHHPSLVIPPEHYPAVIDFQHGRCNWRM